MYTLRYKGKELQVNMTHDGCIRAYVRYQDLGYDPEHFVFVDQISNQELSLDLRPNGFAV